MSMLVLCFCFTCVFHRFYLKIMSFTADWTVKCGLGWQSNPVTPNCYMFVDQPLSWLDAMNQCKQYGGDLVAIETLEEQNYLAGELMYSNIHTQLFFAHCYFYFSFTSLLRLFQLT